MLSVVVFEKFRALCLEYYEIDPCCTYSTPGLTWLCGLKYTNVKLKYYKENTVIIYDTIQHGIREGLASVLADCHVKFYASAMVQALPTGEIKVCDNLDPGTGCADYTQSSSPKGCIYTIDLKSS